VSNSCSMLPFLFRKSSSSSSRRSIRKPSDPSAPGFHATPFLLSNLQPAAENCPHFAERAPIFFSPPGPFDWRLPFPSCNPLFLTNFLCVRGGLPANGNLIRGLTSLNGEMDRCGHPLLAASLRNPTQFPHNENDVPPTPSFTRISPTRSL